MNKKIEIDLVKIVDKFAENKDMARDIRLKQIIPALEKGDDVILNFKDIDSTTQSFIHALISDLIRNYGEAILDRVIFKNCNETVKAIISIVTNYMLSE